MRVIVQKNNHLRTIKCDCCGSVIEYNVNEVELHSSNEDGFGGDIWLKSIMCPNCKNKIVFD